MRNYVSLTAERFESEGTLVQKPALSAHIAFSGPGAADVRVDAGRGYEALDDYRLLFQFFAKTMYNLGPHPNARLLRDHMNWAAQVMHSATLREPFQSPDITAGHVALVPVGSSAVGRVVAFLGTGRNGKYINTEYQVPRGQEEYYAHMAVIAYLQALVNTAEAWGNLAISAAGLQSMCNAYSPGPVSWDSIPGILTDAESGLHAGTQALGDEMARRGLV